MNKHIELVKKWLADKDSVSQAELKANAEAAAYASSKAADASSKAADAADAAFASASAADWAAEADAKAAKATEFAADGAARMVKKYEELTNE